MASYEYIELSGTVVADTSETKTEVQDEYKEIFGDDLDLSDETPEGVLINAEVLARNGVAINNANLANQINPKLAGGIFLDAIWSLTSGLFGIRVGETRSTITGVALGGVPLTFIPQGSIATVGAGGDQFETTGDVTLDGGGSGTANFQSVEFGPIVAGIGDLDTIASGAPLGWETVTNATAAVLGTEEEDDEKSRLRREDTLGLQGISVSIAVSSALNAVDGVKSSSYRENFTDTDQVIDGVFMLKHSTYSCVDGGLDSEVAAALFENKTAGANWNGAVSVNVTDDTSGQTYPVKFDRPAEIDIWERVTIAATTISNPADIVETAILNYANGLLDGERGYVVGANVSPFELGAAVNSASPGIFVKNVEISTDGIIYTSAEQAIEIFEVARTDATKITTVIS